MSSFTVTMRRMGLSGWRAADSVLRWYSTRGARRRATKTLGRRIGTGCLGYLIFGIAYFFIPLTVFLLAETVVVTYATLVSTLFIVGMIVDGVRRLIRHLQGDRPPQRVDVHPAGGTQSDEGDHHGVRQLGDHPADQRTSQFGADQAHLLGEHGESRLVGGGVAPLGRQRPGDDGDGRLDR